MIVNWLPFIIALSFSALPVLSLACPAVNAWVFFSCCVGNICSGALIATVVLVSRVPPHTADPKTQQQKNKTKKEKYKGDI